MIPCKELREIDFGKLEGMTFGEVQRHYPRWDGTGSTMSIPGGESLSHLVSRIKPPPTGKRKFVISEIKGPSFNRE